MAYRAITTFCQEIYAIIVPLYLSMKSYMSSEPTDDVQWMSYWCMFGFFMVIENIMPFVRKLTFYSTFKLGLLVWLINKNGSTMVYNKCMKPGFLELERLVEDEQYRNDKIQQLKNKLGAK